MVDWFSRRPEDEARPTRGNGRPSVSELTEHLLVGEYPRRVEIAELREVCDHYSIKLVHTPIHDGSADDMLQRLPVALAALEALLRSDERVYLHCNAGLNRAPTLAIAYLRANCGMSLNEALAHVKKRRAC